MSYYYAQDALWSDSLANRHAGNKARRDVEAILRDMGWKGLPVAGVEVHEANGLLRKAQTHRLTERMWLDSLESLRAGDVALFQLPLVNHTVLFDRVLKKARQNGVATVALIHDVESMRFAGRSGRSLVARMRMQKEEVSTLRLFSCVIAHNDVMSRSLVELFGLDANRVVTLEIFDYLHEGKVDNARFAKEDPMAVCGSLRIEKAGYLRSLPPGLSLNLYGDGYNAPSSATIHHFGSFSPEELVGKIEGSFGLVWDGPSAETCAGTYGGYLKVNNPHKASMYLAAGMPVAIWAEAALARFVEENGVGVVGQSISDIVSRTEGISLDDYLAMKAAAIGLSAKLRSGMNTKLAITRAIDILKTIDGLLR